MKSNPLVVLIIIFFLFAGASGAGSTYYIDIIKEQFEAKKIELDEQYRSTINNLEIKLAEANDKLILKQAKINDLKERLGKTKYSENISKSSVETIERLRRLGYDPKIINNSPNM